MMSILKNKKGMEMWQLVLIILGLIALLFAVLMIAKVGNHSADFFDWLGGFA